MPEKATTRPKTDEVHPLRGPRQRTLRRRINNWSIYRTIRRAIRDCHAQEPILMAPCGYGWFFDRFQKDGIAVVGIDIDHETVEYARTAVTPAPKYSFGMPIFSPLRSGVRHRV